MDSSRTDDLLVGGIFVAIGLAFAIVARTYDLGTALSMGPGYVPMVLGGLLALLGLVIAGQGLRLGRTGEEQKTPAAGAVVTTEDTQPGPGPVPWVPMLLIVLAALFFGFTVRGLGLAPALLVTIFLAALAANRGGIVSSAAIAVALTVLCIVIFVFLLQLRLPLFGIWLGG